MENINLEEYLEGVHADNAIQFEGLDYAIVGTSQSSWNEIR